ncbi:TIM-barrel protein, nifR3 family [Gleimia coleocanis DSM 15436]|uniref:TIM-barrel protein, nifR3 family n=1 Tax=Gleimia coleocanis DSM 15436 TaxID=525245 RepID=C0W0B3_9ACTO|nr:tRNA dihydrouridine synthase DusB [Gleimia coleocanis]EEH63972.1 TIM-barrel protein, nifR3 family [Gleimia coleocanis DSM 15436]
MAENVNQTTGALQIGPIKLWAPVVLAPMAGVTDVPFRRLSREFGEAGLPESQQEKLNQATPGIDAPAGLYVCEMITARALVEKNEKTMHMAKPDPQDRVRSLQLYGTDPVNLYKATHILLEEDFVDHIDLNFGCPVPKVTKKGGGAALPWKLDLFDDIVNSVVRAVTETGKDVPVTIKMRVGIDDAHHTFRDAGRIAEDAGIAAVALHGRTQAQYYSGHADWDTIAQLKQDLTVPVLGNGDIFSAQDAKDVMAHTGCDAVVVGRGAQGRPWLFHDLVATLTGESVVELEPNQGRVAQIILQHAQMMIANSRSENEALRNMRKHIGWYLRGFKLGGDLRMAFARVSTYVELEELLLSLDPTAEYPMAAHGKRGRAGGQKKPHLPHGWLDSRYVDSEQREMVAANECDGDGG